MRFLFDSNAVIALMARHPVLVRRVETVAPGAIALSSIVVHELMFGAYNSVRIKENLDRFERLQLPVIAFDEEDACAAGEIRARLRREGRPIGPYDVLIAGQARARDLVLVTANVGEFARVAGLKVEDWTLA